MEDIKEKYLDFLEEEYEYLTILNDNNGYKTILVKQKSNNKIFIKKEFSVAQLGIYQQLKALCHPNLVEISDVCYGKKACVVIEDYVSGRTLQEELEKKGKLSYTEAISYLKQILEGLTEIHRYHIIHRDLKPENILISTDGIVKLLDFGIARFQKEKQTKDTTILGTVGYASPEQFGFQQTDMRTDIYAVGIVLNKMLTGKMPNEELVEDKWLRRIIIKCTEIDPKNRYDSVEELKKELQSKIRSISETAEGKKNDFMQLEKVEEIQWIPGFRTGVTWKKILACMCYVFFAFSNFIFVLDVKSGGIVAVILEIVAMIMYIWLPIAVVGNLFRWDRKVPVLCRLPRELRIALRIMFSIVLIYIGLYLDNYVRYTLVGLSKPN